MREHLVLAMTQNIAHGVNMCSSHEQERGSVMSKRLRNRKHLTVAMTQRSNARHERIKRDLEEARRHVAAALFYAAARAET